MTRRLPTIHGITEVDAGPYRLERMDLEFSNGERRQFQRLHGRGHGAVVVVLADQPLITAQDVRDLLAAYATRPPGTAFVRPVVDGLPGNPVVFSSAVALALLAGGPDMGGVQWQAQHPAAVFRWATSNSHYRLDVDNEADRQAVEQLTGKSLRWPHDLER